MAAGVGFKIEGEMGGVGGVGLASVDFPFVDTIDGGKIGQS